MIYRAWNLIPPKGVCHLETIKNVPAWAHMHNGAAQAGRFPPDAHFQMSASFPKDVKLADALQNTEGFLVLSEKLRDFLAAEEALKNNESLEVGIVNHKGRREKARYFVVHQIERPRCVDASQTIGERSAIEPGQYAQLKKLVLLDGKVDPEVAIFRAAEYPKEALFRGDLAEKVLAGGFTGGIHFFDLDKFDDEDRFRVLMGL